MILFFVVARPIFDYIVRTVRGCTRSSSPSDLRAETLLFGHAFKGVQGAHEPRSG